MDINNFYMEIGLLCQNSLENCLWEELLEAFNMLMSMGKGGRKQHTVFHTSYYGTICFAEYFRGQMILGTHFRKYCSRLSISKYISSQGNTLPRSSQV